MELDGDVAPIRSVQKMALTAVMKWTKLGPTEETMRAPEGAPILLTLPRHFRSCLAGRFRSIRTETIIRNRNVEPKETGIWGGKRIKEREM